MVNESANWDVERVAKAIVAGAAVLASYMYGVAYFSLSNYYGPFGLTPEDAGVTQAPLVARALTGMSLVGGFFVLFLVSAWISRRELLDRSQWHRRPGLTRLVVGALAAPALALSLWQLGDVGIVVALPLCMGVAFGALWAEPAAKPTSTLVGLRVRLGVVLLLAALLGFAMVLDIGAEHLRHKLAQEGHFANATPWEGVVRISLGIQAPPVEGPGVSCGRVLARSGDTAWVLDFPMYADVPSVEEVKTAELRLLRPRPACWGGPGALAKP